VVVTVFGVDDQGPIPKEEVIDKVASLTQWWLGQRYSKISVHNAETMAINPFLMPLIMRLQSLGNLVGLADFLLAAHLANGHNTGFGKLIDEKVLPQVFKTKKLTSGFRNGTPPFGAAMFDEVDHLVPAADGRFYLLPSQVVATPWQSHSQTVM